MASKTERPIMKPEFDKDGHQTRQSMMYGHIDPEYLHRLLMEHKNEYNAAYQEMLALFSADPELKGLPEDEIAKRARRAALRKAPVKEHLGWIIWLVMTKTVCSDQWHSYSADWKEEMMAYGIENMLLYCHNYDREALRKKSKNGKDDPYYYLANAATWACVNIKDKKKKQHARLKFSQLNDNLLSSCTSLDQYAGVVKEDTERKKVKAVAEIGTIDNDDAVDIFEKAFPDEKNNPNNESSPNFGKVQNEWDDII